LPNGDSGTVFPYRDLIIFTAFCVVLGTLVLQGLTLRPLLTRLDLQDDDPVGREVDHARTVAYGAAIAALDGNTSPLSDALRVELQSALMHANAGGNSSEEHASPTRLRLRAVEAARRALLAMRASGEIGDDAFHRLEEEIDRLELSAS
jgi:CPA1 family monovalent cation:H+ antiporter